MAADSSAKKRVVTNAAVNLIGFAAQVVVAFFLAPILLGGLGERRYGVWALVESVLAYLTIFDLGLSVSVVRYVARFEAKGDRDNLNRVFSTSLFIFALSGLLVLAISVGLGLFWPDPEDLSADLIRDARWLFLLLGFNIAIGFPLGVYAAVVDGLERYPAKTFIRTSALVIRAVLAWQVIAHEGGLVALAIVITSVNIAEQLIMVGAAKYYLPALRFAWTFVNWETFHGIRGYSFSAFVAMIAGRISFQTDALVIGAFMFPEYVTFFMMAARLVAYAKDTLRALTTVLTPAISALEARNDYQTIQRLLIKGSRYVFYFSIPTQVGFVLLGMPFLSLWLGQGVGEKSYPVLVILSIPLALVMSQSISGRIFYGIGQLRWFAIATIVEALANLGLSLVWVKSLGIEGVAWGTAIPNVLFNLVVLIYVCRTLSLPLRTYIWRSLLIPLAIAPVIGLSWWWLGAVIGLTTWPRFLTVATAGWVIHGLAAFIVERMLFTVGAPPTPGDAPAVILAHAKPIDAMCRNSE